MSPGEQDVIIRLVGTPGVTLENALKVLLPSRVNIRMNRNIIFSNGADEAEVSITVRDTQGNPVPVGHVMTFEGGYAGCLLREDGSGEGGNYTRLRVTRPGQIVLTYRNDIACNLPGFFNIFQGTGGYIVKGSPLLLGP
jgi:hypothetical protein